MLVEGRATDLRLARHLGYGELSQGLIGKQTDEGAFDGILRAGAVAVLAVGHKATSEENSDSASAMPPTTCDACSLTSTGESAKVNEASAGPNIGASL